MERRILSNKPLVEAIFELKWDLSPYGDKNKDPHYRIIPGSIYAKIKDEYPFHEPLPTVNVPIEAASYIIQHRFRKAENEWPLVQVGPGIITLNETEDYRWESFQDKICSLLQVFDDIYPEKENLQYSEVTLRYLDAINFEFEKEDVFDFLQKNMKTRIGLNQILFEKSGAKSKPLSFDLKFAFPVDYVHGVLHTRFRRGRKSESDAIIWETTTQSQDENVLQDIKNIEEWTNKAHELTDSWFFTMIEGELAQRFQ